MEKGRHPLRRLLSHLKHHQLTVILASICSILNKFWDLAPPILIGMAIDVGAHER
jgi:ATP-binding cassette subfamily B protein